VTSSRWTRAWHRRASSRPHSWRPPNCPPGRSA